MNRRAFCRRASRGEVWGFVAGLRKAIQAFRASLGPAAAWKRFARGFTQGVALGWDDAGLQPAGVVVGVRSFGLLGISCEGEADPLRG